MPGKEIIEVPGLLRIVGPVDVSPTEILVSPNDRSFSEASYCILLLPGVVKTFRLLSVELPFATMDSTVTPLASGGYSIRLSGLPEKDALHREAVRILTDAPGAEVIEVPFRVAGR